MFGRTACLLLTTLAMHACTPTSGIERDASMPPPDHGGIISMPVDAGDEPDATPLDGGVSGWVWKLPPGIPVPRVPADNPMSGVKVELGRHLFYDTRLSGNETQSCASCHEQARAFADGRAVAIGSTGELTPRNAMGLANVAFASTLTWANPLLLELEAQSVVPIFGREPVELGLSGMEGALIAALRADPRYAALFPRAFPDEADPFSVANVTRGLAAFERTLISGSSTYDRFIYGGEPEALSESARRGLALFNSERLECFHCHQGFNFADSVVWASSGSREVRFHNTGLYNIGGTGAYPPGGTGVHDISGLREDMGRFRAPSLRNVAVTAPYMHDGSIATLSEVLDHYAAGGRTIASGPYAGVGSANPYKSGLLVGFTLTPDERAEVLSFLEALTDSSFLTNPSFADPWSAPCALCEVE